MERLADVVERVDVGRLLNGTDGNEAPARTCSEVGTGAAHSPVPGPHTGRGRSVYFSMLRAMTIRWIWLVPS